MVYGLKIVLASSSPRRIALLEDLGVDFIQVNPVHRENKSIMDPGKRVEVNAHGKAESIAPQHPNSLIIGSDTVIFHKGRILGKPKDLVDAKKMIRSLSGQQHIVYTGVSLIDTVSGRTLTMHEETEVWFEELSDDAVDQYVMTGEPLDKAGAINIQGLGGHLVDRVKGSFSNVVGLPLELLREMLAEFEVLVEGH